MDFELTKAQEAFRKEISNWLDRELSSGLRDKFEANASLLRIPIQWTPEQLEFNRKIGAMGWIGIHWPKEYGGGGRPLMDQFIILDELASRAVCICNQQSLIIVPSLLVHGSEEQKRATIPYVAKGEMELSLGYTEPEAGSDLSNLSIRAVADGDYFVINGQKMFNTMAHWASYHWLAARTDPEVVQRSRGITMFLVDLKLPGIKVHLLETIDGARTNMVFYDDVRVHKSCMVGELNRGFHIIMAALDEERLLIFSPQIYRMVLRELVDYAKATRRMGASLFDNPIIRRKLAEIETELECANLLYQKAIWMVQNKIKASVECSIVKLFLSEFGQRFMATANQILGIKGQLRHESKWAPIRGFVEAGSLATIFHTIGGGTSEIMRDIIAVRGCELPRSR